MAAKIIITAYSRDTKVKVKARSSCESTKRRSSGVSGSDDIYVH